MLKTEPENHKDLLKKLHVGDFSVFDQIYDQYSSKLFYFTQNILKNTEDAEEIVQEVFVKIWEKRDSLHKVQSFKSYLFSIAYHAIIDVLRKRLSQEKYLDYLKSRIVAMPSGTVENIDYNSLKEYTQSIIEKMPPRRKQIYELSRDQGLSHKEIAKQLNITSNTVENHIANALKFIKQHLTEETLTVGLFLSLFVY